MLQTTYLLALSAFAIHKKNIFTKFMLKAYIKSKKLHLHLKNLKKLKREGRCFDSFERICQCFEFDQLVAGKIQNKVVHIFYHLKKDSKYRPSRKSFLALISTFENTLHSFKGLREAKKIS